MRSRIPYRWHSRRRELRTGWRRGQAHLRSARCAHDPTCRCGNCDGAVGGRKLHGGVSICRWAYRRPAEAAFLGGGRKCPTDGMPPVIAAKPDSTAEREGFPIRSVRDAADRGPSYVTNCHPVARDNSSRRRAFHDKDRSFPLSSDTASGGEEHERGHHFTPRQRPGSTSWFRRATRCRSATSTCW